MLCEEIYDSALALLGESLDQNDNTDYEERVPYLIAAFCTEVQERDKLWRDSFNLDAQSTWNPVFISLDTEFPLSERFASAAAFYVAAMLVIESDEELSDKLYDRFCDAISTIDSNTNISKGSDDSNDYDDNEETTAYILESIKNVYF